MTKEQKTTKQMIDYCKARIKEVRPFKGNYYQKIIKTLTPPSLGGNIK